MWLGVELIKHGVALVAVAVGDGLSSGGIDRSEDIEEVFVVSWVFYL